MPQTNPYLEGNNAPVTTEETVTDLPVTGTLPSVLNGRYLRNGPNPITPPDPATYHWFSGHRHGARHPHRGRACPLVPQPLGPLCRGGRRPGRAASDPDPSSRAWTSRPTPT